MKRQKISLTENPKNSMSQTLQQKIDDIKFELSRTQVNKATMHHICMMRAKMAKYQRELLEPDKKGPAGEGFDVAKFGDARVGMVGFPSVGKSTLLSAMTPTGLFSIECT